MKKKLYRSEPSKARSLSMGFTRYAMRRGEQLIAEAGLDNLLANKEEDIRWLQLLVKYSAREQAELYEKLGLGLREKVDNPTPLAWAMMIVHAEKAGEKAAMEWIATAEMPG
jgi:hypothetical protein